MVVGVVGWGGLGWEWGWGEGVEGAEKVGWGDGWGRLSRTGSGMLGASHSEMALKSISPAYAASIN